MWFVGCLLQLLCAVPEVTSRYVNAAECVVTTAPLDPATDLIGEFAKLVIGLSTERFDILPRPRDFMYTADCEGVCITEV